jgi:MFS family permease
MNFHFDFGDLVPLNSKKGDAGIRQRPPALRLGWIATIGRWPEGLALPWFVAVFSLLGAAGNGGKIAQLGYLMEVSPDERRPAYSGYFNTLIAPATILPIFSAALAEATSYAVIFGASCVAILVQILAVRRLLKLEGERMNRDPMATVD